MKKVFVNGTFDILHIGHIELLKFAKSQGDMLFVAIDSDRRVREKKGTTRPVNNQSDRYNMLFAIKYIDLISVFDSDEELIETIKSYSPDIMIVGSDWKGKPIVGGQYSKKIYFFDRIGQYSTTRILNGAVNETSR